MLCFQWPLQGGELYVHPWAPLSSAKDHARHLTAARMRAGFSQFSKGGKYTFPVQQPLPHTQDSAFCLVPAVLILHSQENRDFGRASLPASTSRYPQARSTCHNSSRAAYSPSSCQEGRRCLLQGAGEEALRSGSCGTSMSQLSLLPIPS